MKPARIIGVALLAGVIGSYSGCSCLGGPNPFGDGGPDGSADGSINPDGGRNETGFDGGTPPKCVPGPGSISNAQNPNGICNAGGGPATPTAVFGAGGASTSTAIYVVGGFINDGATAASSTVAYASVADGGTLGSWTSTTALPTGLGFVAAAANQSNLYVLGGNPAMGSGGQPVSTVSVASINSGNTLGGFNTGPQLPDARAAGAAMILNGYLYYFGGYTTSDKGTAVGDSSGPAYVSTIGAGGSLGNWASTTPLPFGRQEFGAFGSGNNVYIVGGRYQGSAIDCEDSKILTAPQNSNGTLGAWSWVSTEYALDLYANAIGFVNGNLVVAGGVNHSDIDATGFNQIFAAPLTGPGQFGSWYEVATQPLIWGQASAVVGNNFYAFGGNSTNPSSATWQITLSSNGTATCP